MDTNTNKVEGVTPHNPAVAAAATSTTGVGSKKKRGNSKQPAESKAAKKKKKDTPVATAAAAASLTVAAPVGVTPATALPTSTTTTNNIPATTIPTATPAPPVNIGGNTNISNRPLVDQVLYRLTEGVPRMELKAVVREADECEKNLLHEIQLLEAALLKEEQGENASSDTIPLPVPPATAAPGGTDAAATAAWQKQATVDAMLETPLTPMDRCFTLSALLGRLRDDLALPSLRRPAPQAAAAAAAASKKKKTNNNAATSSAPTYPQLVALADHPNYTRIHQVVVPVASNAASTATPAAAPVVIIDDTASTAQLLHVWRKIASHRTAMVFRKAVKPEEAPGYIDRILFPMDLGLVRKMIVARILTTYSQVHQKIRLISHNCVKYNGRESDYGIVAREFEAVVDEYVSTAVYQQQLLQEQPLQPGAVAGMGGGRASPKNYATSGGSSGRSTPKLPGSGRASPYLAATAAPSAASTAAAAKAASAALAPPSSAT